MQAAAFILFLQMLSIWNPPASAAISSGGEPDEQIPSEDKVQETPCSFLLEAEPGAIFIHDGLGIIEMQSYDPATDELAAVRRDRHVYYRYKPDRLKAGKLTSSLTLTNASQARLAPIRTSESFVITHQRTLRYLGDLERPTLLYALAPLGTRLMANPQLTAAWVDDHVRPFLEKEFPGRNVLSATHEELALLLYSYVPLLCAARDDLLKTKSAIRNLVEAIYRETGEDLVLSGLLWTYANSYPRGLLLPGYSLRSGHLPPWHAHRRERRPTILSYLPQDVDHYSRSYIWQRHERILKTQWETRWRSSWSQPLPDFVTSAEAIVVFTSDKQAYKDAAALIINRIGSQVIVVNVDRIEKPRDRTMPFGGTSYWDRIWRAAGSLRLDKDVRGRAVAVLGINNPFVNAEVMRILFDKGAKSVGMITGIIGDAKQDPNPSNSEGQ
ncbi:MAG: hypothetical protein AB7G93_14765 [Bdellovibrionales bacterium]